LEGTVLTPVAFFFQRFDYFLFARQPLAITYSPLQDLVAAKRETKAESGKILVFARYGVLRNLTSPDISLER
jgi:hypothetical protein